MTRLKKNIRKSSLREKAEERLLKKTTAKSPPLGDVEMRRLFHELQVHQIELVMQNEELKQAREELDVERSAYKELYDLAPTGYMSLDRYGIIRKSNLAGADLIGMERSRLINRQFALFVSEDDRPIFKAFLKRLLASNTKESCELTLLQKGEERISVIINAAASENEKEFFCVLVDVTEKKYMEESLRKSETQYRTIFENTGNATLILEEDSTISLVNVGFENLFHYTPAETENQKSWKELVLEEDRKLLQEYHRLRRIDPEAVPEKYELKIIDNHSCTHNVYVTVAMIPGTSKSVVSIMDISQLKEAEEALRIQAQDLSEANTTMKVLLNTMEKDQEELKEIFLDNIKAQVLPYLDKLKKMPLAEAQEGYINLIEANLDKIASPFIKKLSSNYLNLTKMEIQIAALVKEGKTSREIAELLDASKRVIEFHRGNIRRKLGLNNKKGRLDILLRSYS